MFFYDERQYELLWELIPRPEEGMYPQAVWLYRSVAAARDPAIHQRYFATLRDYFTQAGFAPIETLHPLLDDEKKRYEVAYYLAIHALINGDVTAAHDWFHVSVDSGFENKGEYRWSRAILEKWKNKRRTLNIAAKLAEKR